MSTSPALLDLDTLADRCDRLAPSKVRALVEAAAVMLDKFHSSPAPGMLHVVDWESVKVTAEHNLLLRWAPPSPQSRDTHANELDATEEGAYAVAFAAVMSRGYRVVRRAHHGSGADFILAKDGEPDNDYHKLEVSGVARGNSDVLDQRLVAKMEQVGRGDLDRPGLAVVVGFQSTTLLTAEQR